MAESGSDSRVLSHSKELLNVGNKPPALGESINLVDGWFLSLKFENGMWKVSLLKGILRDVKPK